MQKWLECMNCRAQYPVGPLTNGCACGGPLQMQYDLAAIDPGVVRGWLSATGESVWQYAALLPLSEPHRPVTLGEGQTPLLPCETLRRKYGQTGVFLKNEAQNPTWSHKDRYHTTAISMARALGFPRVVTASTGNHGVSAAAYAARGGLRCLVFFAAETSPVMWQLAGLYGAQAVVTSFDGRGGLLKEVARHPGWYPASDFGASGGGDPFGIEGYKTIAFEVLRQLGGAPDAVLIPVGSGNLLYGVWKGFQEAKGAGMTASLPRIIACQAAGANALDISLREGRDDVPVLPDAYSVATSTREKTAGVYALRAVRESGGRAVVVDDAEILAAIRLLGEEGLCAETASAMPVACASRLLEQGAVAPRERIVCIVTSSGVKWPELLPEVSQPPRRMPATGGSIERLLSDS